MKEESFKVRKNLLDEVRAKAKKNRFTIKTQVEVYLERGVHGDKSEDPTK